MENLAANAADCSERDLPQGESSLRLPGFAPLTVERKLESDKALRSALFQNVHDSQAAVEFLSKPLPHNIFNDLPEKSKFYIPCRGTQLIDGYHPLEQ
jgi:hypothetical protein